MSAKAKTKLTPQQRKATLTRVLGKIKPYSLFVVCSLIVAAVSVGAQLYIPILCGSAIDMMLGKGAVDFGGVMRIIIEVLVVAGVAALAQWLLSVCNNRITFLVSRDLRNEALRKIQPLPLSYLDSHPSGDIVSRMVADVDTFADGLLMGFTQLFSGVLTILGTLLFMLSENVPITLVVVCITPLSLVVASFLAKRSYGYFQSQSAVRGEQTALVNEMIEGQKVVQAFGHEAESLTAFDEVNGRLQDVSLKAIFFSSLTNPATRFVNNIVYAGVGLVGAVYAVRGGITIGQLSVFLSYANQYTKPFNEISGVVTELQNALACAARVFELLDADDQVPEVENASVLQPDGHVQLEDVSFRYLPDRPLIEGLSLDVKPGQRIAIVGPTGCGKTTLINLLMRFYDVNGGSIKVSGTDIRDVTRASLRGSYGMVLQDTWLRAGTVRENIAYGKPDATMDEVITAAKAAHAHGVPLMVDNTFPTPVNCRPFEWGADIVTHSTTKYMDGHGAVLGGAIVDGGKFDWMAHAEKFPGLCTPDDSYHGITYAERFGKEGAFITKATAQLMRDFGSMQSPMNAYMLNLGLESLHVRMQRHCANGMAVAEFLESHPKVAYVNYCGLESSPYHALAEKYLPDGSCGVVSFGLAGGREAASIFMKNLKLAAIETHVADARTCCLNPASSTHRQMNDEQLKAAGVPAELVRMSCGLESSEDLIADIAQALDKI